MEKNIGLVLSKHWLQFETVSGNIEMIGGIVYSVSGRDKALECNIVETKVVGVITFKCSIKAWIVYLMDKNLKLSVSL